MLHSWENHCPCCGSAIICQANMVCSTGTCAGAFFTKAAAQNAPSAHNQIRTLARAAAPPSAAHLPWLQGYFSKHQLPKAGQRQSWRHSTADVLWWMVTCLCFDCLWLYGLLPSPASVVQATILRICCVVQSSQGVCKTRCARVIKAGPAVLSTACSAVWSVCASFHSKVHIPLSSEPCSGL